MNGVEVERWRHRPNEVRAVEFRGFRSSDANGDAVITWLQSYNIDANRVPGDLIEYDTGTDDLTTRAAAGDWFVVGPEETVHRVRAHMWNDLYERAES